jgi:hypothetical protein
VLFDGGLTGPGGERKSLANEEGESLLVATEVSVAILAREEFFSIISGSITWSMELTLTARKKAQADRRTQRGKKGHGKNEMWLLRILTREAVGSYRVIVLKLDDRVEVQRCVGGGM